MTCRSLLLGALCTVSAFSHGDDTSLLLQKTTMMDLGQPDDDLSALQAPAANPNSRGRADAEMFKAFAKGADENNLVQSVKRAEPANARWEIGLAQVGKHDMEDSGDMYRAPKAPYYDPSDKHTVSVLQGGIKLPEDKPVITVCNAYAFPEPLDIKLMRTHEHILNSLAYKDCIDLIDSELQSGDELEFQARGALLGVFHISTIPEGGTQLLLVPHRRHPDSYLMKFDSHAFQLSAYKQPMIATIDAYAGTSANYMRLVQDSIQRENVIRVENISYGTVSVVSTGSFQVQLVGHDGDMPVSYMNLTTGLGRNYVVMRVGGGAYREDMVVYPQDSAALGTSFSAVALLAALQAFFAY